MPYGDTTVGVAVLDNRGLFKQEWWRWVGMGVLLGYAILFNILVLLAQTYLGREPLTLCQSLEMTEPLMHTLSIQRTDRGICA